MKRLAIVLALVSALSAQELSVPATVVAGEGAMLTTSGSGSEKLLVFGPGVAIKRDVKLGDSITLTGEELARVGRYTAVLGDSARSFYVRAAGARNLSFIARPSRVPVSRPQAIIGVAFVFDANRNLVLEPQPVRFELASGGSRTARTVQSQNGVAWLRWPSGSREGAAQFTVSLGEVQQRRVIQQVASDACTIRMKAERQGEQLLLTTDPIKDCSGNALPDGTIVTFAQMAPGKVRSTVDARIKRGTAAATLPAIAGSTITVASGVILGNEIRVGGGGD